MQFSFVLLFKFNLPIYIGHIDVWKELCTRKRIKCIVDTCYRVCIFLFFFFISFTLLKSTQNRVILSFVLTKNNTIWPWATRRSNYVPVQHIADKIFHFLFPMNQNSLLILVNCRLIPRIYSVVEIYSWNRTERKIRITKRREVIQKQRNNKIGKNSNMFIKLYVVIFVIYLIYWHSYYQCSLYLFIKW
jgi:hypothetical protein